MGDNGRESIELDYHDGSPNSRLLPDVERQQEDELVVAETLPPSPKRSTAFLDGLRGLAAFFVFLQHINSFDFNAHDHGFGENDNYYVASLPFLRIVFSGGDAAVTIFFVLSGYVLSKGPLGLLRDDKHDVCTMRLLSAVIRRPIRLYLPPLGVSLAVAIIMQLPFGINPAQFAQPKDNFFAELVNWFFDSVKMFNPFQIHGGGHGWFAYDIVVWTLPIELKGSMVVYGLTAFYACFGMPLMGSLVLLAITTFVLLQLAVWTMGCFVAGLILAYVDVYSLDTTYITHCFSERVRSIFKHVVFVAAWYLLCQPSHGDSREYSLDTPGWHYLTLLTPPAYDNSQYARFWTSWGAILLVYATLRINWLQTFLNFRVLQYLGKVSFIFYLIHLPVLNVLAGYVSRMMGDVPPFAEESWLDNLLPIPDVGPTGFNCRFLVNLAIILPICLLLADLGTRVLDTPSVNAGNWLVRKLRLDRSAKEKKVIEVDEIELKEESVYVRVWNRMLHLIKMSR